MHSPSAECNDHGGHGELERRKPEGFAGVICVLQPRDGDGRLKLQAPRLAVDVWSSRSAPGSASSRQAVATEKPQGQQHDHSPDERDQHGAENRVPDDRDAPVK